MHPRFFVLSDFLRAGNPLYKFFAAINFNDSIISAFVDREYAYVIERLKQVIIQAKRWAFRIVKEIRMNNMDAETVNASDRQFTCS
jgi:hypothetical protein